MFCLVSCVRDFHERIFVSRLVRAGSPIEPALWGCTAAVPASNPQRDFDYKQLLLIVDNRSSQTTRSQIVGNG